MNQTFLKASNMHATHTEMRSLHTTNCATAELPQDVWDLISQFLSEYEVLSLLSLNRPMFDIALSRRYRTVVWADPDEKMVKWLRRLQEPMVAARVRRVEIRAWFMKRLLDMDKSVQQEQAQVHDEEPQTFSDKLFALVDIHTTRVRRNTRPPRIPTTSISNLLGVTSPSQSLLASMARAMACMVNVRLFTVEWRDLPFSMSSHALLTSANQSFSTSLCKLSLSGQLSKMDKILPLTIFRVLEEMELKFDYDERNQKQRARNDILLAEVVAPYINSHRGTLQQLKVVSNADADHSRLFQALPHLRLLHTLILEVPFDENGLSNPDTLQALLQTHAYKLRTIEILPIRVREADVLASVKGNWVSFCPIFHAISDRLVNLTSLSIPSVTHPSTVAVLQTLPATIKELRLAHRYHSAKEVAEILQICQARNMRVRTLSIDVISMTPKLLQFLSEKLPLLDSLTLVLEQAETSRRTFADLRSPYSAFSMSWNLTELSIYMKNYRDDESVAIPTIQWEEFALTKMVTKIIPSIRRSKGKEVFTAPPRN